MIDFICASDQNSEVLKYINENELSVLVLL